MTTQQTITIKNREYTIEATGLKHIAYKLHSGRLTLTGIRNQHDTDIIVIADKGSRKVGTFRESTMREVVER